MATSAYMSWLQKRESKVSRSPSTPADAERSEPQRQEGGAYSSWLRWRERHTAPLAAEEDDTTAQVGGSSSPSVERAGKRARSWGDARKDLDAISLADEFALKRRKRVATSGTGGKNVEKSMSATNAKASAPRASSLPGKRRLEAPVQVEESRKVRRVAAAKDANRHVLSSADEHRAPHAAAPATEKSTGDDPDGPQPKKKTAALLVAECRYWTAVDRFSHLD